MINSKLKQKFLNKSIFTLFSILLLSTSSHAFQNKKKGTVKDSVNQTQTPSRISVQANESSYKQKNSSAPLSLNIVKTGIDINYRPLFIAATNGTDVSLSMTQSQFNLENETINNSHFNNQLNMTTVLLGVSQAFENSLFIDGHIGFAKNSTDSENFNNDESTFETHDSTGILDPSITLGGIINTDPIQLILALTGKISTGNNEEKEISNTSRESNMKIGGGSLTPSLTVYSEINKMRIGSSLAYTFSQEKVSKRTSQTDETTTYYESGGNIQNLSLFIEIPTSFVIFGGSIDYTKIESRKSESKSSAFPEIRHETKISSASYSTITAFASIEMGTNFKLVPNLSYGQLDEGSSFYKTNHLLSAGINGQITF